MEMERQRQTHSKEIESKDEEVDEIRRSCSKKVGATHSHAYICTKCSCWAHGLFSLNQQSVRQHFCIQKHELTFTVHMGSGIAIHLVMSISGFWWGILCPMFYANVLHSSEENWNSIAETRTVWGCHVEAVVSNTAVHNVSCLSLSPINYLRNLTFCSCVLQLKQMEVQLEEEYEDKQKVLRDRRELECKLLNTQDQVPVPSAFGLCYCMCLFFWLRSAFESWGVWQVFKRGVRRLFGHSGEPEGCGDREEAKEGSEENQGPSGWCTDYAWPPEEQCAQQERDRPAQKSSMRLWYKKPQANKRNKMMHSLLSNPVFMDRSWPISNNFSFLLFLTAGGVWVHLCSSSEGSKGHGDRNRGPAYPNGGRDQN